MNINDALIKAAEYAAKVDDKYELVAFEVLLKWYLEKESGFSGEWEPKGRVGNEESKGQVKSEVNTSLKLYEVADRGKTKHLVAWAVLKITEKGEEATVQKVRDYLEVEMRKKKERSYTSKELGKLVPRYLKRMNLEKGKGYCYVPGEEFTSLFDDLKSKSGED